MALIGYVRLSHSVQDPREQMALLRKAGCEDIRVEGYTTKGFRKRHHLKQLLDHTEPGDTIVVTRFDRLARSLLELDTIVRAFRDRGVGVKILQPRIDIGTTKGKQFVSWLEHLAAFDHFARSEPKFREKTRQPDPEPKARRGGRPREVDYDEIHRRLEMGQGPSMIAREMQIARATVYKAKKADRGEVA